MIKATGVPTIVLVLLLCASPFVLVYLYSIYAWLPFVILFLYLAPLLKLSSIGRNQFLKKLFNSEYRKVRVLENMVLALPFALALALSAQFYLVVFPFAMAALAALFTVKLPSGLIFPTPFSSTPFEFMIGFRKRWYGFLLVMVALAMAWQLENVNFAFFAQGIAMFLAMMNYFEPENAHYIWMHRCSPEQFLLKKIRQGLLHAQYASILVLLCFGALFPKLIFVAILIQFIASVYLIAVILAKYVAYPRELSFPEGSKLAIAFWFPPFLLYLIPFWFKQAAKNLQTLLK
ncbi:MAG: hypothetical protein ACPGED_09605 [Flavobacteriales bacterium]